VVTQAVIRVEILAAIPQDTAATPVEALPVTAEATLAVPVPDLASREIIHALAASRLPDTRVHHRRITPSRLGAAKSDLLKTQAAAATATVEAAANFTILPRPRSELELLEAGRQTTRQTIISTRRPKRQRLDPRSARFQSDASDLDLAAFSAMAVVESA
jgi:hypothetical protein